MRGHLGCCTNNRPYVVHVSFALRSGSGVARRHGVGVGFALRRGSVGVGFTLLSGSGVARRHGVGVGFALLNGSGVARQ